MALFTKLFERDHNPYDILGARWYKIHFTSTGTTYTVDASKSDIIPTVTGVTAKLPSPAFKVLNVVLDVYNIATNNTDFVQHVYYYGAEKTAGFSLPSAGVVSELDAYILIKGI